MNNILRSKFQKLISSVCECEFLVLQINVSARPGTHCIVSYESLDPHLIRFIVPILLYHVDNVSKTHGKLVGAGNFGHLSSEDHSTFFVAHLSHEN